MLDDVVRICLAKNPDERWQSAADVVHELKLVARYATVRAPEATKGASRRERLAWAAAVVVAAVLVALGTAWLRQPRELQKASFELRVDAAGANQPLMIALSPDGRNLAARVGAGNTSTLWVRPLERVDGFPLQGTDFGTYPFWSPDGRHIGFFVDGKLKKVDIFGAPLQTLAAAPNNRGGTWSRDGVILFAPDDGPLFRISASGGEPTQVTELDKPRGERAHRFPKFLPDGNHFLYVSVTSKAEDSGVYVGSLTSRETRRLVAGTTKAEFASPDLLLYLRESTLMAQRFEPKRLLLAGDPFQIAEQVASNSDSSAAGFTVSESGILAYRRGGSRTGEHLVWVDRDGKVGGTIGSPAPYRNPRLSPDGKRLAINRPDNSGDIWISDIERGTSTRFTFDPAVDDDPVWSPDGKQIAFVSNRDGGVFNLYVKTSAGTGDDELLLKTPNNKLIDDWSADGRYILYEEEDPKTKRDLWVLPLTGDRKPVPLLSTGFNEGLGSFSPDGRWFAYVSDETGSGQVYVRSFPASPGKWQVSTTTLGTYPRWRRDGKELFYDAGGPMMAVDLTGTVPGGEFRASAPRQLFTGLLGLPPYTPQRGATTHNYDIAPDGLLVANSPSFAKERLCTNSHCGDSAWPESVSPPGFSQ